MRMQMTFKGVTSSAAYQQQSMAWAKAQITVAIGVAIAATIFGRAHLGLHWLWIAPTIVVGTSFLIAMPTMMVNVWLAVQQSTHLEFDVVKGATPVDMTGRLLGHAKWLWSIASMGIAGLASYLLVMWVGA